MHNAITPSTLFSLTPAPAPLHCARPHPANSPSRQVAKSPTFQQVGKPISQQVEKLASWHTPPAGPGRGEQRSTPPRTPCSSPTFPSSPPPHLRSPLPRFTPPVDLTRLNVPPPATSPRPHARIPSPSYPGVNHQTPPTSSPLLPTQQTPVSRLNPPLL